jgi:acyl-CoA synthetase (AMP-forming)/AMP-acid ligase II
VALFTTNDIPSVVALLALLRSGCTVLVLNPSHPAGRTKALIEAVGAMAVFAGSLLPVETVDGLQVLPDPATLPDPTERYTDARLTAGDDALLFGTSGSTATSKLVRQAHRNIIANAEAMRRHHRLGRGVRFLGCLPIHHVNGLHFTIFANLLAGSHAVLVDRFDPFSYPRLIERFRPQLASVVPSILEALIDVWRRPSVPPDLRYFVSAAAPLNRATVRRVVERVGVRVLQGYGLTETTNFSTTMPVAVSPKSYARFALESDIPSIGVAIGGNEVEVLTQDCSEVPAGETGEICMRGFNVMNGYAGNPEATSQAFQGGWFHSGDLGFAVEEPGTGLRFFVITGRIKNIAKVGGEAVSLEEMDRVLQTCEGVRDAACVSIPHRLLGEEIIAAVAAAFEDVDDQALTDELRRRFPAAVVPRRIVRLDAVPRTSTGKVVRRELVEVLQAIVDRPPMPDVAQGEDPRRHDPV